MTVDYHSFENAPSMTPEIRQRLEQEGFLMIAGAMALRQSSDTDEDLRKRTARTLGIVEGLENTLKRFPEHVAYRDEEIPTWITIWGKDPGADT